MRRPASLLLLALVATSLLTADPASAQRRIIGSDSPPADEAPPPSKDPDDDTAQDRDAQTKEDKTDDKKKHAAEAKRRKEEAEKRRLEEEQRREAEEARREAEEEARREAEQKARQEAKKKAEAEAQKKAEAEKHKEEQRLEGLRSGRLKTAKALRRLTRQEGKLRASIGLEPGSPDVDRVVEIRVDVTERLKVPDPRFGDLKPVTGMRLIATVQGPDTGSRTAREQRYVLHPLRTPGSYGFHHTPSVGGEHRVRIDGTDAKGEAFSFELPLHVGVWPPPDFDEEEQNNARLEVASGGRRAVGVR